MAQIYNFSASIQVLIHFYKHLLDKITQVYRYRSTFTSSVLVSSHCFWQLQYAPALASSDHSFPVSMYLVTKQTILFHARPLAMIYQLTPAATAEKNIVNQGIITSGLTAWHSVN